MLTSCRYSSKVDPYIPRITNCLKDESFLIRKQTLTLLAHLLQVTTLSEFLPVINILFAPAGRLH